MHSMQAKIAQMESQRDQAAQQLNEVYMLVCTNVFALLVFWCAFVCVATEGSLVIGLGSVTYRAAFMHPERFIEKALMLFMPFMWSPGKHPRNQRSRSPHDGVLYFPTFSVDLLGPLVLLSIALCLVLKDLMSACDAVGHRSLLFFNVMFVLVEHVLLFRTRACRS